MLPTELAQLIADYSITPVFKIADSIHNTFEVDIYGLCYNPHPAVSSLLEAHFHKMDKQAWMIAAHNPSALPFLSKHTDILAELQIEVDWKGLQEEFDHSDQVHDKVLDLIYSRDEEQLKAKQQEMDEYLERIRSGQYEWYRENVIENGIDNLCLDFSEHPCILKLIEKGIFDIKKYEYYIDSGILYSNMNIIQLDKEASDQEYTRIVSGLLE